MHLFFHLLKRLVLIGLGRTHAQRADLLLTDRQYQSVFLRHLDCGSCNGCELELTALGNPIYDMARFGLGFVASPRHADVLIMTGPFTRNLEAAALLTFAAMSEPRQIVAIGDCAVDGGVFKVSYAVTSRPDCIEQAIVRRVPGCPPTPETILRVLADLQGVAPRYQTDRSELKVHER